MAAKLTPEQMESYWSRTSSLMWTILALWFFFGFVIHFFAPSLNKIQIIGFPLGYYMAAQGSLIVFVVLCVWNTKAQNKIDDEFGVSDE
jgi:putative solute:sodium symporter small subunit